MPYPGAQGPYPGPPAGPPGPPPAYYARAPYPQPYLNYAPGYAPAPMNDGRAMTSLVLGLLSIFCFGILTGIPAIVLGIASRKTIERSGGALGGSGMAIGGIVTGSLGTAVTLLYVIFFGIGMYSATHAASIGGVSTLPTVATPGTFPAPAPTVPTTTSFGKIRVTDLHRAHDTLQGQLAAEFARASAEGHTVLVETSATWCSACKEFASQLHEPAMQRALENVDIVRVDVDEFAAEMGGLHMSVDAVPFFFKIDSTARATDAVSGDEWDDNTAANMAPVLGAFVKGTLTKRRHPSPIGTTL